MSLIRIITFFLIILMKMKGHLTHPEITGISIIEVRGILAPGYSSSLGVSLEELLEKFFNGIFALIVKFGIVVFFECSQLIKQFRHDYPRSTGTTSQKLSFRYDISSFQSSSDSERILRSLSFMNSSPISSKSRPKIFSQILSRALRCSLFLRSS